MKNFFNLKIIGERFSNFRQNFNNRVYDKTMEIKAMVGLITEKPTNRENTKSQK